MRKQDRGFRGLAAVMASVLLLVLTVGNAELLAGKFASLGVGLYKTSEKIGSVRRSSSSVTGETAVTSAEKTASADENSLTATPDDVALLMKKYESAYASYKKTGTIVEKEMGSASATLKYGRVALNNKTESHTVELASVLSQKPSFGTVTREKPYVLIYHTHTTEGYEILNKGWYSDEYDSRTKDASRSVVRVGDEIEKQLKDAGYVVIHDKNIYDLTYNGAYSRSLVTVSKYLKQYPSIVVTLDVHRDAIDYDGGTKCKPTVTIAGKKAAQVMIITGCEEGSVTGFPNWQKNLVFAAALQNAVQEKYEGLMRPIFFCQRKYNMNVTPCSLLLEFGTDANTLDEAVYSGRMVGLSLAALLNQYTS